jgi:hypothetical protein
MIALIGMMAIQSSTGLLFQAAYRDPDWIRAAWYGNDWVTLLVATPLLAAGLRGAARESVRGFLLSLGIAAYAIYNYAFYLFGAALNAFFPIYVVAWVLALAALIVAVRQTAPDRVAERFRTTTPGRFIGGALLLVAAGLAAVWLGIWAAYVFAGRPTPIQAELFKLVAALDLSLMVPPLAIGGLFIWRHIPWGYVIGTAASIQASLYLFVLSVGSVVAIRRGLADAPGEVPLWGALTVLTASIAGVLLAQAPFSRVPRAPS